MGSLQPQTDELHAALHERLVQTGEWHRIMASLRAALDESGWTASLRDHANAQASSQTELNLTELIKELGPYAQTPPLTASLIENIPLQVREQITAMLHDFVARNVEDA